MVVVSTMSKAKIVTLVLTPMVTGSVSFVASLTIIISILRSDIKLSTSYRRLVFGISIYDLLQSIGQAFSSAPMPVGTYWLALGNDTTCAIHAFVNAIGMVGTIFYSLSLTTYFLLVVKYNLEEAKITKYVEPFLHMVPIICSSIVSTCLVATETYDIDDQLATCMINPRPRNCYNDPDLDCTHRGHFLAMSMFIAFSMVVIFGLNCVMMVIIYLEVRSKVKQSQAYRNSSMASQNVDEHRPDQQEKEDGNTTITSMPCATWAPSTHSARNQGTEESSSPLADQLSQPSEESIHKLKNISNRAIGYVVGFLLTYTFFFLHRMTSKKTNNPVPFAIIFLAKVFFPLQGFFNVLVYTYPHVVSCQRNHSEYSWLRAFLVVVKSGGDSDMPRPSAGQRRSLEKKKKALAVEKKSKKAEKRNSGNSLLHFPSSIAANPVLPTMELSTQRDETSSIDLNNTTSLPPIDVSGVDEGWEEENTTNVLESSVNDKLFPIRASSMLMKSDSSNWEISSNNSYDELFLNAAEK